jgi:acyl-CoA synthetase (AMP-forming)/AMP-acid ligase II
MTSLARDLLRSTADIQRDRIAVQTESSSATFDELRELVERRASYLSSRVELDEEARWIPLLVDFSLDSIVNTLACLVGNLPFVVLDPEVPPERLEQLLALLGNPEQVVGTPQVSYVLPDGVTLLAPTLDDAGERIELREVDPDSIQLVMTTSGSTGEPKGVLMSFGVVEERIKIIQQRFDSEAEDPRSSLLNPLHFMGGLVGLFPLLLGESIVFLDPRRFSPKQLLQRLVAANLTQLYVTPQIGRLLSRIPESVPGQFDRLRTIVTGAETVRYEYFAGLVHRVPEHAQLVQIFGSSEGPQSFLSRVQLSRMPSRGVMLLGEPADLDNVRLVQWEGSDEGLHELWRSGPILSGYLGALELNERQFHRDPEGKRWWKSGDLFSKSAKGGWMFSGRSDDMVKIRGKFASPSEVVKVLAEMPHIRASIVLPETEDGRTRFVAHLEVGDSTHITVEEIRRVLAARLPAHLVPARFHLHEELPLTVRGKTDRKALRDGTLPSEQN